MELYRFALICVLTITSGCLRYTHSIQAPQQSEVGQGRISDDDDESFFLLQDEADARLHALIEERRHLLNDSGIQHYRLGRGDTVQFSIYGVPEIGGKLRIAADGTIPLAFGGSAPIAGLTLEEARATIADKLRKYVKAPAITLSIENVASSTIAVLGEVTTPGVIPLDKVSISLLDALALAGGRRSEAASRIIIVPGGLKNTDPSRSTQPIMQQGVEVDFDQVTGDVNLSALNIPLLQGDVVIVPRSGKVDVDGEVIRPGSYELGAESTLIGIIAAAGGLTYSADIAGVQVIRDTGTGRKVVKTVDLEKIAYERGRDIRLRDGDIVRVTSSSGRFVTRQVVEIFNRIINIGVSGGSLAN